MHSMQVQLLEFFSPSRQNTSTRVRGWRIPFVMNPTTNAQEKVLAKKADEGAKTIFDATGNLKDKTRMQQKKRWIK
ncbi:hypothetical protein AtNW77_Chr3g0184481 [Arabidopsis thaliana]